MRSKDIQLIVVSAVFAGIFAFIISTSIFKSQKNLISVPVIEKINPEFPDVQNNPAYKAIFNPNALDPTQPITIGDNPNSQPFQGGQ